MKQPFLQTKNLRKIYPGVTALDEANIDFFSGEVHALLGENGAGKSTLCKLISGAEQPTSGQIVIGAESFDGFDPISAKAAGVSMVYQEISLIPSLSVYENFFLGKEKVNGPFVDKAYMIQETKKALSAFGVEIDPSAKVRTLSVAYQQLVEICKIVYENAKIIILDEPTAPLTNDEVERLFQIVQEVKRRNVVVIYISHRLEELFRLSEKVTVMRDGHVIKTLETAKTDKNELVRLMVARELGDSFPAKEHASSGEIVMTVENLTTEKLKGVSFALHKGEVLGIGGLVGSGRTETLRAIFGADEKLSGQITIHNKPLNIQYPDQAIRAGIGFISEDRKKDGLLMKMSIEKNISVVILNKLCNKLAIVRRKQESQIANDSMRTFNIKAPSKDQLVKNLSGGNQQKVIIAKWIAEGSEILFMDEPTRGIDVAAKQEIYRLIDRFRKEGKAVLMVSSDLPELIGMSDRVIVMYEGGLQGELRAGEITQENILKLASGIED